MTSARAWRLVASFELAAACIVVTADLLLPTLVLLALAAVSLAVRRRGAGTLGFHRPRSWGRLAAQMLLVAVVWSLLQQALLIPVANRLTGEQQDLSGFRDLQGSIGMLLALLVLSWTLAALGEETAFRGYLLTRSTDVLGNGRAGTVAAVGISAVLFGLIHTEQGLVGVLLTTLDAVVFAVLRLRLGTVWAPVLAHGFNNTLGFVTFYALGPFYGFW